MPLFSRRRKPSEDSQKRLEHQLYWSNQEGADDILDISACELAEVPSKVFSICKVQQKKVLILHTNELKSLLPKGCDIGCLATLKVLDLHQNRLGSLPDAIGSLTRLQILNLEQNRLAVLPDSVCRLRLLQTLNLRGNVLASLPDAVGALSCLRTLDISGNNLQQLPKHLADIRTLESLTLDAASMTYPPASVCSEGTESIQRFLCDALGQDYCSPSQYLLPVLESDGVGPGSDRLDGLEEAWQSKFSDYERRKEQQQQEKLEFELHLVEKQRQHSHLLQLSHSHKESVLNSVRQDQQRVDLGFSQQQKAQEAERQQVLDRVRRAEQNISERLSSLLADGSRQKKSAEFLQAMEEDRIRMEQLTAVTQEEAGSLRRREVAAAMQKMLSDGYAMSLLQEASDSRRQTLVSEAHRSLESLDRKFDRMLSLQVLDKSKAIAQILREEEMQKAAFQALQLQRDAVHGYIRSQIQLIEAELVTLTKLEVKRRSLDAESLQEVLAEQRTALSDLLQQLLKQRDQREQELRQVLVEIERKSDSSQQNYWMIQYQRLLDAKPLSLRMQEAGLETELVNLLCRLSGQHHLPVLAHHRVTMETLRHMTAADLKKMGVQEAGIQKVLLSWARDRAPAGTSKQEAPSGLTPPPTGLTPPPTGLTPPPTGLTPPPSPLPPVAMATPSPPVTPVTPGTPVTPSAPAPVDGPGGSECVVCMEVEVQLVFLPCGHVCCCRICSDSLLTCPLCRSCISQRIRLYQS